MDEYDEKVNFHHFYARLATNCQLQSNHIVYLDLPSDEPYQCVSISIVSRFLKAKCFDYVGV